MWMKFNIFESKLPWHQETPKEVSRICILITRTKRVLATTPHPVTLRPQTRQKQRVGLRQTRTLPYLPQHLNKDASIPSKLQNAMKTPDPNTMEIEVDRFQCWSWPRHWKLVQHDQSHSVFIWTLEFERLIYCIPIKLTLCHKGVRA